MPGRPLRKARALLLAAALVAPAGAVDIKVPVEGKPSGSGVGAAGAVGSAAPGAIGVTPQLGLDLGGSIKAVAGAPAPVVTGAGAVLAAPLAAIDHALGAPLNHPAPPPSAAQLKAALNMPPGYIGHDPGKPVFWPANAHALIHEPADKLSPATLKGIAAEYEKTLLKHELGIAGAGKAQGAQAQAAKLALTAPGMIGQAYDGGKDAFLSSLHKAASQGEAGLDDDKFLKGLAAQPAKPAVPVLSAPADAPGLGIDPASGQAGYGPGLVPLGVGVAADPNHRAPPTTLKGSQLAPFGSTPAGAALQPPTPPMSSKLAGWFASAWGKLSGGTPAAKQGKAAQPPPVAAPFVAPAPLLAPVAALPPETEPLPAPARQELENAVGLLVHAPRAARRDAGGYHVHFLGLSAQEGAESVKDRPVRVRLRRSGDEASAARLRERFGAFNRLIENNFAALELLARHSGQLTVKTARSLYVYVEAMAADYGKLVERGEYQDVIGELAAIGVGFEAGVKEMGLSDADLLPPELLELVAPIDKRSVHHFINRIHQGALENLGRAGTTPPNVHVTLSDGETERRLELTDISENPLTKDGRIVSRGFKALVGALLRSKDAPKGALVMQDHQFQGHFRLGAHSAEIYANFLPPDEGGMIRVRYQEWGTGYDNQTRLYYVARLLQKTGFHVEQSNGFLTAIVDKDHAAQSVDAMTETFALVVQALHATVGVDFALPMLVEGALTSEEVGRRIDGWVDIVLGEGTLPFYVHDDQEGMIKGWGDYIRAEESRARLRAALDARLAALGLPPIPAGEPMGQRAIDRFVSEEVERALARGQLTLSPQRRLLKTPGYDPVARMATALSGGELAASRMAEVVSSLDPALLSFETVGSLGALSLERAQRRLDSDTWLTVHALRDPKTGQIGFASAEFAALEPGGRPRGLSPDGLFKALAVQGHPVAPFTPSPTPPGFGHFSRLLRAQPEAEPADRVRFMGLPASPAHGRPVVARVTYDKARAARGGHVYLAPYTTPDDLDAIKASKAVLTTSGGLLSHAAITTREMDIPAAILAGVTWSGGVAALESRFYGARYAAGEFTARRVRAVSRTPLPEGAVVRLDPATGALEAFPGGSSAALLDAAAALERYDAARDGRALAAWLGKRVGSAALTPEQKGVLALETLSGLAARALERPEAAGALTLARAALTQAGQAVLADGAGARVFSALREKTLAAIAESRAQIARSLSVESMDRARVRAAALAERLSAVAAALGRPKEDLGQLVVLAAGARRDAARRAAALLAADVAELDEHARKYPSATMESLPLMKAAIAKARRRELVPELVGRWEEQVRALEASRERAMKAEKPLVMPLEAILDADVAAVGGKGAKLGEIAGVVAAAGGVVPTGVVLTVHAYRAFLAENGIAGPLEALATDRALTPEQRSARAKRLILGARLTPDTKTGRVILAALREKGLDKVTLAVRSSAVDEDGAEAAFAGAGDTHLYVSPDDLLSHVQEVWSSLWNPRALLYRQTKGLSTANMAQAVVLQEMVASEVAGVAFTQDPVSGDASRLVVNSAFGLGEGVVSNRVAPDQYVVSKEQGVELLPPLIGDKKLAVLRAPGGKGTVEQKMPPEWRRRRSMTPEKLAKLNKVAVALERYFGYALDLEYGFTGDTLHILQARPVTVAAPSTAPGAPKPKSLLFVCTGNTCRSPMAEQMARARLLREGREDVAVGSRGLVVAGQGEGISPEAAAVLAERGIDGRLHAAQALSARDVADADVILAMTAGHAAEVLKRHPAAKGKVFTLAEYAGRGADVSDPYGRDIAAYRAAADAIEAAVAAAVSR